MEEKEETNNGDLEPLIEANIIFEINSTDLKDNIYENIKMTFPKDIIVKEMITKIINNLNTKFNDKEKAIYLNPEGMEYFLCECPDREIEQGTFNIMNAEKLPGHTMLIKTKKKTFRLLYNPKDIILNFKAKKDVCTPCVVF